MTAIQLKNLLIHRISEINDLAFLKAIKTILDSKAGSDIIKLTAEQKQEIAESRKQIEKGLFTEDKDLQKEINKWLSEK